MIRLLAAAVAAALTLGLAWSGDFGTARADEQRATAVEEPSAPAIGPVTVEQGGPDAVYVREMYG